MNTFLVILNYLFCVLFTGILFTGSPDNNEVVKPVNTNMNGNYRLPELKTGDLVFRSGKGLISDMFARVSNTSGVYSHVGIVLKNQTETCVFHILDNKKDQSNHLICEPLNSFVNNFTDNNVGIYRLDLSSEEQNNLVNYIKQLYKNGMKFDDEFSLDSDEKQYCSELVNSCISSITGNSHYFKRSSFNNIEYLSLGDLTLAGNLIFSKQRKID